MSLPWKGLAEPEVWTLDNQMFGIWCNFASATFAESFGLSLQTEQLMKIVVAPSG